jgi:UDP:flavonoid glycosyltransferase YjiC (YdhE family)
MASFLFVAYPIAGHVYPMLSIAAATRAKGHEVFFIQIVPLLQKLPF